MFEILIKEMNKWLKQASEESICEMMTTLVERAFDRCKSDMDKAELISVFTDAMEMEQ